MTDNYCFDLAAADFFFKFFFRKTDANAPRTKLNGTAMARCYRIFFLFLSAGNLISSETRTRRANKHVSLKRSRTEISSPVTGARHAVVKLRKRVHDVTYLHNSMYMNATKIWNNNNIIYCTRPGTRPSPSVMVKQVPAVRYLNVLWYYIVHVFIRFALHNIVLSNSVNKKYMGRKNAAFITSTCSVSARVNPWPALRFCWFGGLTYL